MKLFLSCLIKSAPVSMMSSSAAISSAKSALRSEIAEVLSKLSPEEKTKQSEIVFQRLVALPSFQKAAKISTYLSIDNEINTEPIVRRAFAEGKQVFVPRYNKKGMEMVRLESMQDWETLPVTSWGIKQPSFKDQRVNASETGLDFIVVPGVGFTSKGNRLGHGGGYYDRFMKGIRETQKEPVHLVAVAFKEQVLPEIPVTEEDVTIDLVLYAE